VVATEAELILTKLQTCLALLLI